jgi:hypothetical protein
MVDMRFRLAARSRQGMKGHLDLDVAWLFLSIKKVFKRRETLVLSSRRTRKGGLLRKPASLAHGKETCNIDNSSFFVSQCGGVEFVLTHALTAKRLLSILRRPSTSSFPTYVSLRLHDFALTAVCNKLAWMASEERFPGRRSGRT